jgi:8-oxo-dGTP pyrophosphatase MutT (NUDIX family)
MIFTKNGLDKNKLIKVLVDNKVITKKMTIDDHDAEGNPHTARMIVKYSVPKERFNERLDALYDMLFPDAEGKINEDGAAGGGATSCSGVDGNGFGSGEFVQPLFGGISVRKKKKDKKNANLSEFVNRVINRIISEAVTGKDADKAAAIYAYCLDDKEEDYCILCAKRIEGDEKGKWNPPMGHLHVGESPKDGAVRECEEESGVKIPKSKLQVGSYEDWGRNYWVILDGTIKDWPVGKGDGENTKFEWKNVYGLFYGKDKDLEWAWNTKDFIYKFAPAELDLD